MKDPPGAETTLALGLGQSIANDVRYPTALGIGHDGALYVGNADYPDYSSVYTFAPHGTTGVFRFQLGAPTAIAFDGSGRAYFTSVLHHGMGTYVPIYSPTKQKVVGTLPVAGSTGLAIRRDGFIFVASVTASAKVSANTVAIFAADGRVVATIKTGISSPYGLVLDQYGNVYVLNQGNNTITVYSPGHWTKPLRTISTGSGGSSSIAIGTT